MNVQLIQLIDNGMSACRRFFKERNDDRPMTGPEKRTDHFQDDFFSAAGKQSGNDKQHLHEPEERSQNLLFGTIRSTRLIFSIPKDFFRSSKAWVWNPSASASMDVSEAAA